MTNNKKGLRIMAATLCLTSLLAFLFGGCRDDGHPSGGHTTHTDPDAPKTIQSTDLAEFSVASLKAAFASRATSVSPRLVSF